MTAALGPFEPGPGRLPPYLAGREAEQRALAGFVARLRERRPPPSDLILYGPRGNGKTVLLKWLEQEVIGRNENRAPGDAEIGTLWLTPTAIPTVSDVARQLAARGPMDPLHVEKVAVPGLVDLRLGAGNSPGDLVEALTRRLGEGPLVLLLDEAHRLRREAGEALLNASQQVGSRAPFLLVLAGTPDLRWKLRGMIFSFWPRSHSLPIGRLSRAASREAVRIPLRRDGIGISHGAQDAIVDESRRYPFFLQLWGGFLWRAAHARRGAERTVRRADVSNARSEFRRTAHLQYLDRYEELAELRLLEAARAVAVAFGAGPPARQRAVATLSDRSLEMAVQRGLRTDEPDRIRAATRTLFHLGYIWRSAGEPEWEPGIPSLMDYIRERVAPVETRP